MILEFMLHEELHSKFLLYIPSRKEIFVDALVTIRKLVLPYSLHELQSSIYIYVYISVYIYIYILTGGWALAQRQGCFFVSRVSWI